MDLIESELQNLPEDESALFDEMMLTHVAVFNPASYGFM